MEKVSTVFNLMILRILRVSIDNKVIVFYYIGNRLLKKEIMY